jgi:hypothetical protein
MHEGRFGRTCNHEISFGAAEDLHVQQSFDLSLSKGGLEITMEGVLDVRFVQTTFLVNTSTT